MYDLLFRNIFDLTIVGYLLNELDLDIFVCDANGVPTILYVTNSKRYLLSLTIYISGNLDLKQKTNSQPDSIFTFF